MAYGVSTSCLYPLETELSLKTLCSFGIEVCELFFNSPGEMEKNFVSELKAIADGGGLAVRSVHPWSSFAETHMLFSEYGRRFANTLDDYKKYFDAANILGASFVVIHGSRKPPRITGGEYIERFYELVRAGKKEGVTVIQENVNAFLSESPDFLREMRHEIGEDFKMVFDIKQAVRAGYEPIGFAKEFAESIAHIHISDHRPGFDCLAPGKGEFDFASFIAQMNSAGYDGDYIIELYRHNFGEPRELLEAKQYMECF